MAHVLSYCITHVWHYLTEQDEEKELLTEVTLEMIGSHMTKDKRNYMSTVLNKVVSHRIKNSQVVLHVYWEWTNK